MTYSLISGRFHYNNNTGDYFDFEGFVSDTFGGGSFIAGETIAPGNPKGWKYKSNSLPNSYVEIFKANNYPGSIYDAPGFANEYLVATNYYDANSDRYVSTTGLDSYDIGAPYFGDLEGELFTEGMAYKFDIETTIDLPIVVSSPSPSPNPEPTPAPAPESTPAPSSEPTSSDPIIGTAGKDKLKAKVRSIEIYGMGGNDKITGSNGDDILDGGFGNDKIKGKKGSDIYILSPGKDKFQGFKIREGDTVQIDSSIDFEITGSRKSSKIEHDMGVTTVKKVSPTDLETVIEVV